jgi:hypothetical protein
MLIAQVTKEKNKLDILIMKTFCASKDNTQEVKRQCIERVEIFANHIFDKGFFLSYYV